MEMITLVEAVETGLPLLDELRLELAVTVAWDINVELAALAFDRFRGLPVAGVSAVLAGGVVLLVAEEVGHLALQRTLDDRLGELLEETVVAQHVFRQLVVFQEFGCNRHKRPFLKQANSFHSVMPFTQSV